MLFFCLLPKFCRGQEDGAICSSALTFQTFGRGWRFQVSPFFMQHVADQYNFYPDYEVIRPLRVVQNKSNN